MLATIFRTPAASKRYSASPCSLAFLLFLSVIVIILVIPFVLAYAAGSFWLKDNAFWEQPAIVYSQEMLVLVEGQYASTGLSFSLSCSSSPTFNQMVDSALFRLAAVKVRGQIECGRSQIRLLTRSLIFADAASSLPGASVYIDGDLNLVQRVPMQASVSYVDTTPALNFTQDIGNDAASLTWQRIVMDHSDKNIRVKLNPTAVPIWSTPRASSIPFTIQIRARIPTDRIMYTPGLFEVLKNGWIQYISTMVIVLMVVLPCYDFLLRYQVVGTHVSVRPLTVYGALQTGEMQQAGFKAHLF
eukprot:jgi/Hompol1/5452/HPOL_001703-RA